LANYFDKLGIGHARLLRELRAEQFKNVCWKYRETEDGHISVTSVRLIEKPAKNAAPAKPAKNAAPAKPAKNAAPAKPAKNAAPETAPEPAN
jgi:hypothetical protein